MRIERMSAAEVAACGGPAGAGAYLHSLVTDATSVAESVREIVADVRDRGDAAVLEYTRRFDTRGAEPRALAVPAAELEQASDGLAREVLAGLEVTIANVALVADAGVGEDVAVDLPQGHRVVLREVPVASAAVYVPGGRAPYPSTVAMGVVTARAAGVVDVAVCAPPGPDGQIDAAILGACRLCGVHRVYRMGGAQAVAALAYGTESVTPVDVVVGPGNLYVQEAKRLLFATVGVDGFAGPSDLMVLLGAEADARAVRLAALDMLAQAEHGAGTIVAAVACGAGLAQGLAEELERLSVEHDRRSKIGQQTGGQGAVVAVLEVLEAREAIALANAFAPEHVQLIGADVEARAGIVTAAGCVFLGAASATAFGDYVAGSNHILPTGGAARFASGLSARDFRRRMTEVRIGDEAVASLAAAGAPIARAEGFEWHARSMEARIGEN
jgi:histidinol dehydrogenase